MAKDDTPGGDTPNKEATPGTANKPTIIKKEEVIEKDNGLAVYTNPAAISAEKLIMAALEKGVEITVLEKIFDLRDRLKGEYAKEAFFRALAAAQQQIPIIEKKTAGAETGGKVAYYYAQLGDIAKAANPAIHENGLSYMIRAEQTEKGVKVSCIVTHELGHSEETMVSFPMTKQTGIMSEPQVVAATMTFAKRYAFCNAFGIMTAEEDDETILQSRVKNLESFAFTRAKENIESISGKELEEKVKFLQEEFDQSQAIDKGAPLKSPTGKELRPKLGLTTSQYQSLLVIAKARLAGEVKEDGRDDKGFEEAQK